MRLFSPDLLEVSPRWFRFGLCAVCTQSCKPDCPAVSSFFDSFFRIHPEAAFAYSSWHHAMGPGGFAFTVLMDAVS